MESFSQAHRNLQLFCADFWDDPAQCVVILGEIGVSPSAIDMTPPAIMRWFSIIRHLMRLDDGSMGRLVVVLMKQYPQNDALRAVCAPWIPALPAQIMVLPQKRLKAADDPVPIVAPADFADEADSVVPKVDTLWSTMVEVNKRLILLEASVLELRRSERAQGAPVDVQERHPNPSGKGKA